jgi:hypothetical protein
MMSTLRCGSLFRRGYRGTRSSVRRSLARALISSSLGALSVLALCGLIPTGAAALDGAPASRGAACSAGTACHGAGISNGGLDIWAGIRYPAQPGVAGTPGTPGSDGYRGPFRFGVDPHPIYVGEVTPAVCALFRVWPWYCPRPGQPATPDQPAVPEVSLDDLQRCVPENPTIATQPAGWTVAGLPTNMLAGARRHVVAGTVLGLPVEVAFVPAGYRWQFGDGTSAFTTSTGATWQAAGVREFAPTATSHIYANPGTYTARVEAVYRVSYRFYGFSWQEVSGEVSAQSGPTTLVIARFDRALVSSTCEGPRRVVGCSGAVG